MLDLIAPSGGVVRGEAYLIGSLLVIAATSATEGAAFRGHCRGVVAVTKVGSQAWSVGVPVYWDDSAQAFTTTASGNLLAGLAVRAVGSGSGETTGRVRLDPSGGAGVSAGGGLSIGAPVSPVQDDVWIELTGTSPNRIVSLQIYDDGEIVTIASVTH